MDIGGIVRDSGIADAITPAEEIRQQQALRTVVDETGRIANRAARPFRTPFTMHWYESTGRQRLAQAGTAIVVAAHADTAPSGGSAFVTVTAERDGSGVQEVAVLEIPNGRRFAEERLNQPVLGGSWIGAAVTTASGAANVSISLVIRGG